MARKTKVSFRISKKDLAEIDYQIGQGKFRDRSDFFTSASIQLLGKLALYQSYGSKKEEEKHQ